MSLPKSLAVLVLLAATPLASQEMSVTVDQLVCVPLDGHGVVIATVTNDIPGSVVRLYFRRLHLEVEDLYYVEMRPTGEGRYWGVFPVPEETELNRKELEELRESVRQEPEEGQQEDARAEFLWAAWWKSKELSEDRDPNDDLDRDVIRERASLGKLEVRDWMRALDEELLQEWLEELEYEPVDYYAAVFDASYNLIARSEMRAVPVMDDCRVELTPQQEGYAKNLTVGETARWQRGERPFHWRCDGIVSRIDPLDIIRGDAACRACIIAWWNKKAVIIPLGLATLFGVSEILDGDDDEEPSPFLP